MILQADRAIGLLSSIAHSVSLPRWGARILHGGSVSKAFLSRF